MRIPTGSDTPAQAASGLQPHEAHELLTALVAVLIALAAGAVAAAVLRRSRLHWSWAPCALLLLLVSAPALGAAGPLAMLATSFAALRGRRRHRDDLEAGVDLARGARARLTPLGAARKAAGRVTDSRRGSRTAPARRTGTLLLGRDPHGRAVRIPFSAERPGHALVVGATGSGKTVTQTLIAEAAIEDGRAVVAVDPKGDASMRGRLAAAAARAGRRLVEWSPGGPCVYNPYARGGETEIADRLLAGEHFTEPHYLRQAQRYLGHAIRALRATGNEVSLAAVVELLDPQALEALLRRAGEADARSGHSYLDSLTARQLRDLAGIRDRLAILSESEVGRWLGAGGRRRGQSFDLLGACRSGAVVLFRLEADSRPLLAQMLGAAVIQDLQSTVAALQHSPAPTLVLIDEFSALGARQVTALFGRARSAGISLLLGTQEIADLRLPGSERLLEQVLGNLSHLIAHRQVVPGSAELISRLAGQRGSWRVSWSSRGNTTRSRGTEPAIDPELLTGLSPGCGVLIGFGAARAASLVEVRAGGGRGR
jgi:hypothetical protein